MLRSQGRALYLRNGDTEHEPARRTLALDFGLQALPWPGPGWPAEALLPPALACLPASLPAGSAARIGPPRLPSLTESRSPEGADPGRKPPGKVPTRASPGATDGDGHFTWASASPPAGASPPPPRPVPRPLCSALSPLKLIGLTRQFALVWKTLKNLETFGATAAPGPSSSAWLGLPGAPQAVALVGNPQRSHAAPLLPGSHQSCRMPLGSPATPDPVA